ncbi:EVI5 isoform X1 [Olea europaea subsp. europaea]|uniref:EVI5 isoform X1 n=1 Tax=Olea europaea subsp. europaea TaxID=158383 RepID=A0A8S0RYE3_OLEEU|nr:EVI5 isoform X1 [Olea europaea subsp. europaea]
MDKKKVDEHEVGSVALPKVDRFGFVKPEANSADGLTRSRSAFEYERESKTMIFGDEMRNLNGLKGYLGLFMMLAFHGVVFIFSVIRQNNQSAEPVTASINNRIKS